jgi:hypothetical protein
MTNHAIAVSEHVDLMPSEDGHLTETCKGKKKGKDIPVTGRGGP